METSIKLACMILIMLFHGACRTNRTSEKLQSRSLEKVQNNTRNNQWETQKLSAVNSLSDSSEQIYQLTIFPVDSFRFSVQEGFRGKASKLELKGTIHAVEKLADSSMLLVSKGTVSASQLTKSVQNRGLERSREFEKIGFRWWWVLIAGVGVALVLWVTSRWRRIFQ